MELEECLLDDEEIVAKLSSGSIKFMHQNTIKNTIKNSIKNIYHIYIQFMEAIPFRHCLRQYRINVDY